MRVKAGQMVVVGFVQLPCLMGCPSMGMLG
jgi:hypothetical protein